MNNNNHTIHRKEGNLYQVFAALNAQLKKEDRRKGRSRGGGYVSWPASTQARYASNILDKGNHYN